MGLKASIKGDSILITESNRNVKCIPLEPWRDYMKQALGDGDYVEFVQLFRIFIYCVRKADGS